MPINPNIALSARAPNIGDIALDFHKRRQDMQDREKRNNLVDIQTQAAKNQLDDYNANAPNRALNRLTERDQARAKSLVFAASTLKPLLESNNIDGARSYLEKRKADLDQYGIDSSDTQEILETLDKDPNSVLESVNQTMQFGTRLGFLKENQETFEPILDDTGKVVGQRSTTSGKVVEDPRAPKQGRGDYITPVQTAEGVYGFNTRTGRYVDPASGQDISGRRIVGSQSDPNLQGKIVSAKEEAKAGVEKKVNFPKARNTLASLNQQWDLVEDNIALALKQTSPFTAGVGAWTKAIPATPAKDLEQTLETIKANIGFDKLQDMRANSPTGGALGQVSDFENRLLQSVKGSLVQNQSVPQLRRNLERVQFDLKQLREYKEEAFQADFGEFIQQQPQGAEDPLGIRK